MNARLEQVIRHVQDLPSLPTVAVELLSSMERDDIDIHALAAKISLDQALTAKVLRVANSSFYGMSCQVGTLQQAISVLGFNSIRTLVSACSIARCLPVPSGFDFEQFWCHAIGTAAGARALARALRQNQELAFISGLLHDLGALILAMHCPNEYAAALDWQLEHGGSRTAAEREVFGFDHAAAGRALAAYWRFPVAIQEAVGGAGGSVARTIGAAALAAYDLDTSPDDDPGELSAPALAALLELRLGPADCEAIWAETRQAYQALCHILTH